MVPAIGGALCSCRAPVTPPVLQHTTWLPLQLQWSSVGAQWSTQTKLRKGMRPQFFFEKCPMGAPLLVMVHPCTFTQMVLQHCLPRAPFVLEVLRMHPGLLNSFSTLSGLRRSSAALLKTFSFKQIGLDILVS